MGRGLFQPAAIRRYVDEHLAAERDHSFQLWTLMLELWYRRFIEAS